MEFLTSVFSGDTAWAVLMFIVVLGVLVTFHELGHYWAARSVGIKVLQFSVGFGKEIFGWHDKAGTRWSVCWVPLGGYVRMLGHGEDDAVKKGEEHLSFDHKNVWQRIWVVFAGPLANFVLAFLILVGLMMSGEEKMYAHVGLVVPDSAGAAAGFEKGDKITAIDGAPIIKWTEVVDAIAASGGQSMLFTIERAGALQELTVQPRIEERPSKAGGTDRKAFVGISPDMTKVFVVHHSFGAAILRGLGQTWYYTSTIWEGFTRILTGKVPADNVGGPIMIAEVAGEAGRHGIYPLLMLMVLISINLGIINLLPIPMLDGGHLLFYFIEVLRGGKPLGEKVQEIGYKFGFMVVACLMIFAISNDLRRVVSKFWSPDVELQEEK